ncbi:hypothetical protein A2U01_0041334, partial [Trifolium medium]|nr:hypothetical protein [Trifolium medium]
HEQSVRVFGTAEKQTEREGLVARACCGGGLASLAATVAGFSGEDGEVEIDSGGVEMR